MSDTFKVAQEKCNQCLLTQNKIVDDARRKQIIRDCLRKDRYFICHKATLAGQEVCCRGFFDAYRNDITLSRAAQIFNAVEYVDVEHLEPEAEA